MTEPSPTAAFATESEQSPPAPQRICVADGEVCSYIWHHAVHERLARETLYFVRLGFSPPYNPRRISSGIDTVLREARVWSVAVYELFGMYDLMMRVWLPGEEVKSFQQVLLETLRPMGLQFCDLFHVEDTISHWPYRRNAIDSDPPEEEIDSLSEETINAVNLGIADAATLQDLVENKRLLGRLDVAPGIKFMTVIGAADPTGVSENAKNDLRERLLTLTRGEGLLETSLYEGSGFGRFIFMGKVDFGDYGLIRDRVVSEIIGVEATNYINARPYTYLGAGGGLSYVCDRIPVSRKLAPVPPRREAAPLAPSSPAALHHDDWPFLRRREGQRFEVKATAFVDLEEWLRHDRAQGRKQNAYKGVLRSVVAMLNADGGMIAIGLTEIDRMQPDLRDKLREEVVDEEEWLYGVLGIEMDKGGRDFDHYDRRLRGLIDNAISPRPHGLIDIESKQVAGRELCLIRVRPSDRFWYYLGDPRDSDVKTFIVRDGPRSKRLSGPEADSYKTSFPRIQ